VGQQTDILIELIPYGEVSGRVRDAEGRPVSGLAVQLLKANYSATGHRSLEIVGPGKTDERGEYRIPSIPPRQYYLIVGLAIALPRSRLPRTTGTPVDVDGAYALTYYPGVTNPSEAIPIEVQPGQDLGGVDLSVYARETYKVRGRLADAVTGQPPQTVAIALQPETLPDVIPSSRNLIYDADTGSFEVRNVVPGDYSIHALILEKSPGSAVAEAAMKISVFNADVDNLLLNALPPASISGRITIEGLEVQSFSGFDRIRVRLVGSSASPQSQALNRDGSFRIDSVKPGEYQLVVCLGMDTNDQGCVRSTPGFYLKYAAFGGSDALSAPIHFDGTVPQALDIVLSPKPARINGSVVSERLLQVTGARLVLIPEHDREHIGLYRFATSDRTGAFSLPGVAPGTYKLFAWEALEDNAYFDPDLMRSIEALGKAVSVGENDELSIEVKVISVIQ
jgi:hypothetical protein